MPLALQFIFIQYLSLNKFSLYINMQTQTAIKSSKRITKRRNRNRRRRKLRQQRKLQTGNCSTSSTKRKVQQKRKDQQQNTNAFNEKTSTKSWEALCLETYQRLTTWQSEAELNFWKARAEWLKKENEELRELLEQKERNCYINEEKEQIKVEPEEQDTDAAYLEFIAVTHRHREELRRARGQKHEDTNLEAHVSEEQINV